MTRRRVLWYAAALACVAAALALGLWRAERARTAAHRRVALRLTATAALTRDAARLWARELERDTRIAVAVGALRQLDGYAGVWRVTRAELAAPGRSPLDPAERAAAESTLADGRLRLAGPFAAPTPSGVGISATALLAGGRDVVVVRSDPGPTLLALAVRQGADGTEHGRLAVLRGDTVRVVAPAAAGYRLTDYPIAQVPADVRRRLAGAPAAPAGAAPAAVRQRTAGRDMLAVIERVPGTTWAVMRQVDATEVDAVVWREVATEGLLLFTAAAAVGLGAVASTRGERDRRLRELAASEARLTATLRASFDAVLAIDERERIVFCNSAAERLLRAAPGTLTGQHVGAIAAPDAREQLLDEFRRFVAGPRTAMAVPAGPPVALVACDGARLERVEVALSKGEAEGGRLCMCIVRDVSEREAAVEALRASEASARAFVENSPYGICRVAPDGRFLAVNPALAHMLGYPDPEALLAVDLGELYVDPAARAEVLRRHAAGEALVAGVETGWRRRDGAALPVRLHSREVRDADGAVAYYEAFVKDMAALRTAEQALRQAERLAAVGRFVSGVAHELNNPLAAVLLFADGLLDDARPPADREAISLIREQSLRARAIVRDLLAFVRGAGGPTATVEARDVLAAAARALAPQAAAEGGRLEVDVAPDLGWLRVDRAGVEQVVTNLVVNAMHAAPGGRVRLAAERAGDVLRVTVDDEGPGIAPEVQARMFEPFFTTKPVGAGTGLGLSVSLGIVERYGGTLAGDNRAPGEAAGMDAGARFTLTLPLAAAPAARAAAAPPARAADARPVVARQAAAPAPHAARVESRTADEVGAHAVGAVPDGAGGHRADGAGNGVGNGAANATGDGAAAPAPRLLVVDDEASIRQALVRFFGRRGWAVDEADGGRAGLARLLHAEATGAPYDLVLSDVRMPDVSGVALHDWLARTRPELLERVVFATGDDASAESAAFVRRTRCRVLEKPFDADTLTALARHPDDGAGAAAAAHRPADAGRT